MASVSNPFVDYLRRYTTASPDHEAAFDEFLAAAPPPAAGPLRLATRVETFLRDCFTRRDPPSVILTGNAGDGKTYLCRRVIEAFGERPFDGWDVVAERPLERDGVRLQVVKDLSELGDERAGALLHALSAAVAAPSAPTRFLIAANEGRLRYLLGRNQELADLSERVDQQLRAGPEIADPRLVLINLSQVTTSSFVPEALAWMTHPDHWQVCETCPALGYCPINQNARRLRDSYIVGRVQLLYQLLEHLDIHVTVRDMLIHLAYSITGNQRCEELQRPGAEQRDLSRLAYYQNVWGGEPESAFRRKASVAQHLDRMQVGEHSMFEVDNFIVSGAENEADAVEHAALFAPAVDLNHRRFAQDRAAYIEGGAERQAANEARSLLDWLPHCRRKLFFEWRHQERVDRLIAFRHLGTYLRLLQQDYRLHAQVKRSLILGLNRAFSHLFLPDDGNLYITAQYLHSAEQSRPLVRLTLPADGVFLRVEQPAEQAYDRAWPDLYLEFGAPPALLRHDPDAARRPQRWRLNLLLVEYLLRLSHGGTFNILAAECELSVRNLKDQLLSAFAFEPAYDRTIEFFVADRRSYTLKKLHIDSQNSISSRG